MEATGRSTAHDAPASGGLQSGERSACNAESAASSLRFCDLAVAASRSAALAGAACRACAAVSWAGRGLITVPRRPWPCTRPAWSSSR